jgi:hypothetical protein
LRVELTKIIEHRKYYNRGSVKKMEEESEDENSFKRYRYIGYTQDFPIDNHKYGLQTDLLMKLAREATKKKDYYEAIRYLNIILIRNPNNDRAQLYKQQIMEILNQLKNKRSKKLLSF